MEAAAETPGPWEGSQSLEFWWGPRGGEDQWLFLSVTLLKPEYQIVFRKQPVRKKTDQAH